MSETKFHDRLNKFGERLQDVGDITFNLDYWDCDCEHNYIHPLGQKKCVVCNFTQEDGPSSIEREVDANRSSIEREVGENR